MFCVILIGYQSVYPYHRGLFHWHWAMICLLVVVCNMACTICEGCTTDICMVLTHWGRVMHICVSKVTIIASDNGLSPGRRQAIIWNNAGMLSVGLLGTDFSEIFIQILTFSFKKMRLKVSSGKWRPFCLGLNVLTHYRLVMSRGIIDLKY